MSAAVPISRRTQIVEAARRILEDQGPEALSMRNVAAENGIRAPSLYEHIADKRALESAIIAAGLSEQGAALAEALGSSADPLTEMTAAWRRWALVHPHVYRLIYVRDLDRDDPAVAAGERSAAEPMWALCGGASRAPTIGRARKRLSTSSSPLTVRRQSVSSRTCSTIVRRAIRNSAASLRRW